MTKNQKDLLNKIHELALDDDHLTVAYSNDQLVMAKRVIDKMEKKLLNIADLINEVLEQ